jgi:hypothetical protein
MNKFSHKEYISILKDIKNNYNVLDYTDVSENTESFAIIRHDIEFSPYRALNLAKIDHDLGIKSSFFVQLRNNCYNALSKENLDIMNEILSLGHSVGAHINTSNLAYVSRSLREFILQDILTLEEYTGVKIDRFSFHRPTKKQLEKPIKIPNIINAYDDLYFHYFEGEKPINLNILYLADSNHQWKWGKPTLNNFANHKKLHINFHPFSWTKNGYTNLVNFKTLTKEKNKELLNSFNSEINNFPKELL